jgi:hypothetical protein
MATIEEAVRAMLITGTTLSANPINVPDSRVTHGYRLQSTELPAVTYEVSNQAAADVSRGIMQGELAVSGIAETSIDAATIGDAIEAALVAGTYSSIDIDSIVITSKTLAPPAVGLGDEQEPATVTVNATIHWRP